MADLILSAASFAVTAVMAAVWVALVVSAEHHRNRKERKTWNKR